MIKYIVSYQNSYVSSYLFKKNLPTLLEKGIMLAELFSSQVFNLQFDFDEWPSSHTNNETFLRPFNGSIFELRTAYKSVFPEKDLQALEEMQEEEDSALDMTKVYKIKYSVNLLPIIGEHIIPENKALGVEREFVNSDVNLMTLITDSEELDIFETDTIK